MFPHGFVADGADYLRDILPAFFLHRKIPLNRLRQIVSEQSRRLRRGRTAPGPRERLHAWVASATAGQIRQIPELLRKVGARRSGAQLKAKLRRIDAQLMEQCSLRNEVDLVFGPRRRRGV